MSLRHTNDMLRAQGFNVPGADDNDGVIATRFDYLSGAEVAFHEDYDDRAIMSGCGWDVDSTPVDVFMEGDDMMRRRIAASWD